MTSRRLAISIRVFLVVILALGLWLGWLAHRARQQRLAVAAIREYGGFVHYDHELVRQPTGDLKPDPTLEPAAPRRLRRLLGDDYFQRVAWVSLVYEDDPDGGQQLTTRTDDAVMGHLKGLGGLRVLYLHGDQATDESLANIRGLDRLESLMIWNGGGVTDAGLANLEGLNRLRQLHLDNSRMTDEGLRHLAGLTGLEHLALQGSHITDHGLADISGLTNLQRLCVGLGRCEVTDAGLDHFSRMKQLELLDLQGSRVTDDGLMKLKDLPKLSEMWITEEGGPITREGIERLKAAMPQLRTVQ